MSLLNVVRQRAGTLNSLLLHCDDIWLCAGCSASLPFESDEEIPHRADCLQIALPKIVKALEVLQEIANGGDTPDAALARRALQGDEGDA